MDTLQNRHFPLGAILTITTGKLMCDTGQVYEILNYMTGDSLFTHQLPRACRECAPWLLRWYPNLPSEQQATHITPDNVWEFLREWESAIGTSLPVFNVPPDDHAVKDPLAELVDMVGIDKVVVIDTDNAEGA